jgi:predicted dehydrogenase
MKTKLNLGIIGCGNISKAYFKGASTFEVLNIVACADLHHDAAVAKAEEHGCQAQSVDELLANPDIDMVINLTVPSAHAEVSLAALEAGKHVHCEKPLAVHLEDARKVIATAKDKGLRVGCAPDTFLGAGFQTCRKLIDDGWIGRPVAGSAFMMSRGPEGWHPNPAFFYQIGGGHMFDMGPYYITALLHLLGPVKRVAAVTSRAFQTRTATCKEQFGKEFPVEVPTHYAGVLEFHSGAAITMTVSFDVHKHQHTPIEIYGTEGSLRCPDPNTFGGPVELWTPMGKEWHPQAFSHRYADNMRGIGAADMAMSILHAEYPQRASGELALHALEVMHAFETSSSTGTHVELTTRPAQPPPLPLGLLQGRLS